MERILTHGPGGRILTNCNVWSPDAQWIAYDTRSDAAGDRFDGRRIEIVHVDTGEICTLFESKHGAHCGVVSWHPKEMKVAFILGPEHPTAEWSYGPSRRRGVIVALDGPGVAINLDARDLSPPFTPGALHGGSHVHVFHPAGDWVSFTYDDDLDRSMARNVAVATPGDVRVSRDHPRNHDGTYFSVLATRTTAKPRPGSDEISRAFEEAWIGTRQALAFQGNIVTTTGATISEVFVVELPTDLRFGESTAQHRLTFTGNRKYPGIQGPRHWLRSSPDGSRIGFLMKDDTGTVQFWMISPDGGSPQQLTRARVGIGSAFTWSPDGNWIAAVVDESASRIDAKTGAATPLSPPSTPDDAIRPEACVVSPNGKQIAYVRRRDETNQICITSAG
jgi:Tol biopolymer transport system component